MTSIWLALSALAAAGLAVALHVARARARDHLARARAAEARLAALQESGDRHQAVLERIEAQLLEKQRSLDHLAHHDPLTGLPNRLHLAAKLPGALAEAIANGQSLAVLFLDLDRFKHVNDTRGHATGDKLLQEVANRIRGAVREDDLVVRMGGDEFVVVLPAVRRPEQVHETAARLAQALALPVSIDGRPVVTTASIGVSIAPRDGADLGALLRHSDTAMYQAKDRGRNNFQVFTPLMDRKLKERVAIEHRLRGALEAGHLDVHYQPIFDVHARRVVALEALVRWRDPKNGMIPPARFIPVAEETGQIVAVGEFVLERTMRDVGRWRESGAAVVPIAVNVSAAQLARADFAGMVTRLAARHRFPVELLQVELTETAMIGRADARGGDGNEDVVKELRRLGVRVAIDDFGTGYSSLGYLKRWRVDAIKIDRSFVRDLVTDSSDHAIVGAILAMARHLGIQVIAEGVEGWPQLERLRQLSCRYAQGYLLAHPQPAEDVVRFLDGHAVRFGDEDDRDEIAPDGYVAGDLSLPLLVDPAATKVDAA